MLTLLKFGILETSRISPGAARELTFGVEFSVFKRPRLIKSVHVFVSLVQIHKNENLDGALRVGLWSWYLVVLQYSWVLQNHQIWASNSNSKCSIQHTFTFLSFWGVYTFNQTGSLKFNYPDHNNYSTATGKSMRENHQWTIECSRNTSFGTTHPQALLSVGFSQCLLSQLLRGV